MEIAHHHEGPLIGSRVHHVVKQMKGAVVQALREEIGTEVGVIVRLYLAVVNAGKKARRTLEELSKGPLATSLLLRAVLVDK